jgi:tetrahydrodipicolinate N-succinyltransferase
MDETEKKLRAELENMQSRASVNASQSLISEGWEEENKINNRAGFDADAEVLKTTMLEKLDEKKKELVCSCFFNHTILFCLLKNNILLNTERVRVRLNFEYIT